MSEIIFKNKETEIIINEQAISASAPKITVKAQIDGNTVYQTVIKNNKQAIVDSFQKAIEQFSQGGKEMAEEIKKIALDMVDLSKKSLEKSDITTNEIEMSLTLLGEAKKLLSLVENHCFK